MGLFKKLALSDEKSVRDCATGIVHSFNIEFRRLRPSFIYSKNYRTLRRWRYFSLKNSYSAVFVSSYASLSLRAKTAQARCRKVIYDSIILDDFSSHILPSTEQLAAFVQCRFGTTRRIHLLSRFRSQNHDWFWQS
jgi:hypothetical protein